MWIPTYIAEDRRLELQVSFQLNRHVVNEHGAAEFSSKIVTFPAPK